MSQSESFVAHFAVSKVPSCTFLGREKTDSSVQHLAGNAEPHPALRAPGMDMRAGESCVMNIPWGVAP
jgi:hypothetical protein